MNRETNAAQRATAAVVRALAILAITLTAFASVAGCDKPEATGEVPALTEAVPAVQTVGSVAGVTSVTEASQTSGMATGLKRSTSSDAAAPTEGSLVWAPLEATIYFISETDLVAVSRSLDSATNVAETVVLELLDGPQPGEQANGITSAIPTGTELRGLDIVDGLATVQLTAAFSSQGGHRSMQARLGQLIYTLTALPTVDRVEVRLDGGRALEPGGGGPVLDQPLGREEYQRMINAPDGSTTPLT